MESQLIHYLDGAPCTKVFWKQGGVFVTLLSTTNVSAPHLPTPSTHVFTFLTVPMHDALIPVANGGYRSTRYAFRNYPPGRAILLDESQQYIVLIACPCLHYVVSHFFLIDLAGTGYTHEYPCAGVPQHPS